MCILCVSVFSSAVSDDYLAPTTSYVFSAGNVMQCADIIILNDNIFEMTEDLTGRLQGFVIDGQSLSTVEGITLSPDETVIEIEDNDGMCFAKLCFW